MPHGIDAALATRLDTTARDLPCYGYSRQGWIVVCTHPQAEFWAVTNLTRRGYRCFLPTHAVKRRDPVLRTLTRTVIRPLFPTYAFVQYDSRDPRRPIRETPGVRDVVRCGSEVGWAPDAAVDALQAFDGSAAPEPPWKPGTPCSLAAGPLAGAFAVVTQVGTEMATVAVMMLGQLREVGVPLESLSPRDD